MACYKESGKLKAIAKQAMAEFDDIAHLDDPGVRIAYQYSDLDKKHNGKVVYADTELVKEKLRGFLPYEFIITFYEPACADMDEEHLKRLMYHELKHVGFDGSDKFRIRPHDIEDFRACIDKWGYDWITN